MDRRLETPAAAEPDNLDTLLSPTGVQHAFSERLLSRDDEEEDEGQEELRDNEGARESVEASRDVIEQGREVFEQGGGGGGPPDEDESPQEQEANDEDEFQDALESVSPTSASPSASAVPLTLRESWKRQRRHFFILSEAGKPIYSLHGDEDELASLMAVMQAMVSYVADMDEGDSLGCMSLAGGGRIVFSSRPPLILVAVSWGAESERQLRQQLGYLYNQILSVLTLNQMTKIFEKRKGFDLRRMLAGSERLLARFF